MECPKCNHPSESDIECSHCGIIFAKYLAKRTLGNAGNQIKTTGPMTLENVIAVSNCGFFDGQPFTHNVDYCRAGGNAITVYLRPGNQAIIVHLIKKIF